MTLSQNEKVRAAIEGALDGGKDLTLRSERGELINDYIKRNPDASAGSIRSAFSKQIPAVVKERGMDPAKVKPTKHIKAKYDKTLNVQVDPKPVDMGGQESGQQTKGAAAPGQQPTGPNAPIVYTAEGIGEMWAGLIETVRIMVPEVEPLNANQKNALGGLWVGMANKYLATHERAALVFMLFTTAGIIGGNIVKGVKARKERKADEREYDKERAAAEREGGGHREEATPRPDETEKPKRITGTPENVSELEAER